MISAEIRWFWRKSPSPLLDWFHLPQKGITPGGGPENMREDAYLLDQEQHHLGLKYRENTPGVEIKSFVSLAETKLDVTPFVGSIELWTKVNSSSLKLDPTQLIQVNKTRWMRKFDTIVNAPIEIQLNDKEKRSDKHELPTHGCNVELTHLTVTGYGEWWTLGFESFGSILTVEKSLILTAQILALSNPPDLKDGILASYPGWLSLLKKSPIE